MACEEKRRETRPCSNERGQTEKEKGGCTNDDQDLARTYGLFRGDPRWQRKNPRIRSIYAKQSASCII